MLCRCSLSQSNRPNRRTLWPMVQVSVGIWWAGVSLLAALWAVNRLGFVPSPESAEASLSAFVPVYSCTRRWHVYPEMSATVSGSPGRISRSSKQSIPGVTLYWDKEGVRECWTTPHGCSDRSTFTALPQSLCVSVLTAGLILVFTQTLGQSQRTHLQPITAQWPI